MNLKLVIITSFLAFSALAQGQTPAELNFTDQKGMKQGHWIKKYPNQNVMYDGIFKDDHPVGEFKRYYENSTIKSVLIYSNDGKEASAVLYHPNGYISSKGKFINQLKEGKWKFFSSFIEGYLICEETYSKNLRNGPSLKFYPDSTLAEQVIYKNDIRNGPWIQYYPNGAICLKSNYLNGSVNGLFEVWFDNGRIEISGQYKNDIRNGKWQIFDEKGSVKYNIEYQEGQTSNRQMDIDESLYLDSLERNKGKITDPEKSGIIR
jgi:antitoxin component YwqK of YwqJK toxin-antitoxin module